jgi:putative ABC transport system substrate-binding protein
VAHWLSVAWRPPTGWCSTGGAAPGAATDALTNLNRKRVLDFAAAHRIPAMYEFGFLVREGGLMSYGPDLNDSYRRAAVYVDKILKGAKTGELAVEQPNRYYLLVNLITAKALGLSIPQSLLLRADEVIQ